MFATLLCHASVFILIVINQNWEQVLIIKSVSLALGLSQLNHRAKTIRVLCRRSSNWRHIVYQQDTIHHKSHMLSNYLVLWGFRYVSMRETYCPDIALDTSPSPFLLFCEKVGVTWLQQFLYSLLLINIILFRIHKKSTLWLYNIHWFIRIK